MTVMDRSSSLQHRQKTLQDSSSVALQDDPLWELAQRVVASPHFARSPLLSKFLLFVVAETLEGRADEITEHQIGVQVFDRPSDYRTLEDNIVRNYARQLRKRLAEHFADQGSTEPVRIDIPLGGYVPAFISVEEERIGENHLGVPDTEAVSTHSTADHVTAKLSVFARWKNWLLAGFAFVVYSVALVSLTWYAATRTRISAVQPAEPAQPLWAALFGGPDNCYIVPSDAGFNLLEDLSRRPYPLADYIAGSYQEEPLAGVDPHSAADLHSQQLTPFVDLQIASALSHLREEDPERVSIRFPRDLRLDDLKNASAVIIGSVSSNPWASVVEANTNFRIIDRPGMQGAAIVNRNPQPGEAAFYASHWNEPAHETFAVISFMPNLSGNGHILLLEGLDVAGTQAAAEMLLHPSAIAPILKRATRTDGSLRGFEVLLRSTSIESNSTGTQVIASRIY
jgi:hypothetical protein